MEGRKDDFERHSWRLKANRAGKSLRCLPAHFHEFFRCLVFDALRLWADLRLGGNKGFFRMKKILAILFLFGMIFNCSAYAVNTIPAVQQWGNTAPFFDTALAGCKSMQTPDCNTTLCGGTDNVSYWTSSYTYAYCKTGTTINGTITQHSAASCPANSTLSGSTCTCASGYEASADNKSCVPVVPPCPAHSTGTYPACACDSGYTFNQAKTSCINTICPHTFLGVQTSSGYGFTTQSYSSSYDACDAYNCVVHYSVVSRVFGVSLYHATAQSYACDSVNVLPSPPFSVTLAPNDPAVVDFTTQGKIPPPMTVVCTAPLVPNAAGDSCMYPDQTPASVTCVLPMVLNSTGTACLDPTPLLPPSGAPSGTSPTCGPGLTMTNGVCVPTAAPSSGTSGNPTAVTGTVSVQFPGDYAKTGEAAAAAAGLGAKLDTLHGDLTGQTTVGDPTALTAADMPGMGTTFDGIKSWTLPAHTSTCPQPQIDLSGVLGAGRVFTLSTHCQLAQDHFPVLQTAMMLVWSISAMFVVLKA